MDDLVYQFHQAVAALCPIGGIRLGTATDRSTWRIDFLPEATQAQRAAAEALKLTWQPDPILPAPPGIWVHEMKSLTKRQGTKLIDGEGTSCYHIVVETEAHLTDPWLQGVSIDIGSTAYLMDKSKVVVWDGTKWK